MNRTIKLHWLAVLGSAALITQVQARGFAGGGGAHFGGAHFAGGHPGMTHAYSAAPTRSFAAPHGNYAARTWNYSRSNSIYPRHSSVASNQVGRRNAAFGRQTNRPGEFNRVNHLRSDWRGHVYASRAGNWHRDWDRGREHWWHGHRCRFVNGSWIVLDAGFDPWWWWPYPNDYDDEEDDYDY
jgi:hypothetical protein